MKVKWGNASEVWANAKDPRSTQKMSQSWCKNPQTLFKAIYNWILLRKKLVVQTTILIRICVYLAFY